MDPEQREASWCWLATRGLKQKRGKPRQASEAGPVDTDGLGRELLANQEEEAGHNLDVREYCRRMDQS
jgi:hypothetical protein